MRSYIQSIFFVFCFYSIQALATSAIERQADADITRLYHSINTMPNNSVIDKLAWFSAHFKGRDYLLGALGEGMHARYDQYPLYRTDAFDCDTYVNTMLALALSDSLSSFKKCINLLRYQSGSVAYWNRHHFTSLDWNKSNQQLGILKDITTSIHDKNNQSVARYSSTLIDKASWYQKKELSSIRLTQATDRLKKQRLAELQRKTSHLEPRLSRIAYIPLDVLFTKEGAQQDLFAQIPDGAVIEIIRPNWDLKKQIGTDLDVSHLGFAFWHHNQLYFREASSQYGLIIDVPLIDYLQQAKASPTIKGINVQQVLAPSQSCNNMS